MYIQYHKGTLKNIFSDNITSLKINNKKNVNNIRCIKRYQKYRFKYREFHNRVPFILCTEDNCLAWEKEHGYHKNICNGNTFNCGIILSNIALIVFT